MLSLTSKRFGSIVNFRKKLNCVQLVTRKPQIVTSFFCALTYLFFSCHSKRKNTSRVFQVKIGKGEILFGFVPFYYDLLSFCNELVVLTFLYKTQEVLF